MKKTNNKGFSLVELIVVIAIMAVLMGVLAPQFLRYVEKSRIQKDNSAISEIANAAKIALADEKINADVGSGKTFSAVAATDNFTFSGTGGTGNLLEAELNKTIGAEVKLVSNMYTKTVTADANMPKIVITISGSDVKITGDNMYNSDGTAMDDPTF